MSYVPSVEEAYELLKKYNKDDFHLNMGRLYPVLWGILQKNTIRNT